MIHLKRRRGGVAFLLLGASAAVCGALLTTGCGSSSSDTTARIRGIDLSVNGATTGVLVNSTAVGGDLTFGQSSSYNFVGQGVSTFSFTTSATLPSATIGTTTVTTYFPPSPTLQLNNGSYYTAYLIGRADVPPISAVRADPRFLQTVAAGDRGAAANYVTGTPYADPPSGKANVRFLNGAPDAGPVDILINGTAAEAAVTYPVAPIGVTGTTVTAKNPVTAYQALSAGTLSVQVNAAGTATVLVPATNVPVSAGQVYTIVITEPTIAPTYGLSTQSDQ